MTIFGSSYFQTRHWASFSNFHHLVGDASYQLAPTSKGASEPIKNDDLVKDASELMTEDKQQEVEKEASEKITDKEHEGARVLCIP